MVSVVPQQAFNATAVVRHMRRLQLGTSLEGPNLPSMLLPEELPGTTHTHQHRRLASSSH